MNDFADFGIAVVLALASVVMCLAVVSVPVSLYHEIVTAPALEVELMQMRIDGGCCPVGCE